MEFGVDSIAEPFGADGFRTLAKRGLHAQPSDAIFDPRTGKAIGRGDWDLNPELRSDLNAGQPPRPAAVLVPVIARLEVTVLFTRRNAHLTHHPGQISFPGGSADPADATLTETALREAREEIGLDRTYIEPLGFLDGYRTGTGFHITPVVAFVRSGFSLVLDCSEVAEAFEVPLRFLMDESNHKKDKREWRGQMRSFYSITYGEHLIWGATAGMIKNMHERLFAR
jgi:8-oxo-dGTP pyrophosphatase MutT (NUDIX family)